MKASLFVTCMIVSALAFTAFNNIKEKKAAGAYIVITATFIDELESRVDKKLREGWTLAGGVSYGDGRYMQAVHE